MFTPKTNMGHPICFESNYMEETIKQVKVKRG